MDEIMENEEPSDKENISKNIFVNFEKNSSGNSQTRWKLGPKEVVRETPHFAKNTNILKSA